MHPNSLQHIDWAAAGLTAPGGSVSGDLHAAITHGEGILFALVDGVGHGSEANRVAGLAIEVLRSGAGDPVADLLERVHAALSGSRGAVVTLADYRTSTRSLVLAGVGNIEAMVFRTGDTLGTPPRQSALLRGGTVGSRFPVPYASVVQVHVGDVLVMASDGIRTDFGTPESLGSPAKDIAERILRKQYKGNDDGLVLVVRFVHQEDD